VEKKMKRKIPIGIFILCLALTAQLLSQSPTKLSSKLEYLYQKNSEEMVYKVWVFFSDKGKDTQSKLTNIRGNLTERALQRRLRNRNSSNLVDRHDIPVVSGYVLSLKPYVNKIRNKSRWLNAVSVEASGRALKEIEAFPFVRKIELVHTTTVPLPEPQPISVSSSFHRGGLSLNYGPSLVQNTQINVPPLQDLGYDGSGVLICMLDAGFNNLQHEALDHLNILHTYDFVNKDSIVEDESGQLGSGNHGTYTLSALAGYKEGQLIGPAYGADFLLAKTEIADSFGIWYERHLEEDNWIKGAEWADSLGADIISSSLGYLDAFTHGEPNYTWQDMDGNTTIVTIGADIAASRGILVVNSAGNEGSATPPQNTLIGPADGDSVLAIGAVDASGVRAYFSSMGPTVDGRIKPDVMAMGRSVYSASAVNPNGYVNVSGTSLSCPLVAGAAALVLQANPNLTNMDIITALKNSADNSATPDNSYGWGIIDAYAAANYFSPIGVAEKNNSEIDDYILYPVYPNPFNPETNIRYQLPATQQVRLEVFNNIGQKVAALVDEIVGAGEHKLTWDASGFSSGVYLLVLRSGQGQKVQKLMFVK
jgi:subtilisin family serine protease